MKSPILITSICVSAALLGGLFPSQSSYADSCLNPQFAAARISGVGTLRASGGVVAAVEIADLNGDTNTDVVALISGCSLCTPPVPNNLSVLMGNGDGTFLTNVNYSTGSLPSHIAVGDLTGDLRPELVVSFTASLSVSVYVNNGDGTFQAPTSVTFSNFVNAAQLLDMNDDGKLDIVADADQVALGNGNGTFQVPITFANGVTGVRAAVGDFNGDGTDDIAFPYLDFINDQALVGAVLGSTGGSFQTFTNSPISVPLTSMAAGKFNGDTFADIVGATGSNYVSVCLSNGDGTFTTNSNFAILTNSTFVATGNFDGDGDDDIVVRTSDFTIVILLCNGNGTFQAGINYSYDGHAIPTSLVVGDVNGDGKLDIAGAGTGEALGVPILLGNGDGTFQAAPKYATGHGPQSPQAGDFNGDGKLDLIVANNFSTNVSLFLNNGDGTFGPKVDYPASTNADSIAIADFNNDGTNDIAVANQNANRVSLLLGKGNGTFFNTSTVGPVIVGSGSVLAGRFDGDANNDVIVVGMSAATFQVGVLMFHGTGFGTFATPLVSAGPTIGDTLAVGLFNADTNLDLVVGKTGQNLIQVMLGNGDGTFQSPVNHNVATNVFSVAVGDLNGDGNTDIVAGVFGCLTCTNTFIHGGISVLLGNGNGTFQNAVFHEVSPGEGMRGVTVADFNGDGNDDVAVTSNLGTVWVLASNGDGTFQPGVQFGVQNTPDSVVAADLDGDGRPDLAVANKAVDTVSVLLNNCLFDTGVPTNQADLAISKTDSPDPVIVDSNITYTVVVTNLGTVTAANVTVTDALPATVSFVSASAGCTNIGSNVICNLGSVSNHTGATKSIVVNTATVGVFTNTAVVSSTTTDPNAANNTATAITTVTLIQTDLAVSKTATASPITLGNNITYTVTVTNKGPTSASSVQLTDTLPSSVNFVSADAGCTNIGGVVTCDLANLGNSQASSFQIVVVTTAAGVITNLVTVSADEADPVATNNTAKAVSTVAAPSCADLTGSFVSVVPKCKVKGTNTTCSIKGSMTIQNIGTVTSTPCVLRYYLSDDNTLDTNNDLALPDVTLKAVKTTKPGKGKLSAKLAPNVLTSGRYVIAVIDATHTVTECNTNNNIAVFGPLP